MSDSAIVQSNVSDSFLIYQPGDSQYAPAINRLKQYLRTNNLGLDSESLARYLEHLRKSKKYSPATKNKDIIGISKALDELMPVGLAHQLAKWKKQNFKKYSITAKVSDSRLLSKNDVGQLIKYSDPKIALIIAVLSDSGLRVSELIQLNQATGRIEKGVQYFRVTGKGRKEREIMLPVRLVNDIANVYGSETWLFSGKSGQPLSRQYIHRLIKKAGETILNRRVTPHSLRHYFATHFIVEKGKSIKAVSSYLGHASTATTMNMYVHDTLKPEDIFQINR